MEMAFAKLYKVSQKIWTLFEWLLRSSNRSNPSAFTWSVLSSMRCTSCVLVCLCWSPFSWAISTLYQLHIKAKSEVFSEQSKMFCSMEKSQRNYSSFPQQSSVKFSDQSPPKTKHDLLTLSPPEGPYGPTVLIENCKFFRG